MLLETLAKVAQVIGQIISDPIGFLGQLVKAVKMGISNFVDNIAHHFKVGFFEWLLGNMPPGIQFPDKWDLPGIFHFVMQILGLTWVNIRSRAVKKLGEPVVAALEEVFEIFQIIRTEGLAGLWKYIKDKLGDIKKMVIDAIMDMLIKEVVKAGIKFIISLLNPVGAFIKACMAIYDIVMFFINNGKKILDLINAIIDSVALIVAGSLDGAAKMVENALARLIPITIGFLASLLGLGNISEKAQKIIHAIQAPINKAIDWVLDKAIALSKKLGLDKIVKKVKGSVEKGKEWAKDKAKKVKDKATDVGKKAIAKFKKWIGLEKKFEGADGSSHRLYFSGNESNAQLMVASNPAPFSSFISIVEVGTDDKKIKAKQQAMAIAIDVDKTKAEPIKAANEADEVKKRDAKAQEIQKLLDKLSVPASVLFGTAMPKLGDPVWSSGDSKTQFGGSVTFKPITKAVKYGSTPTGASHSVYDIVDKRRQSGGASYYIRGHLLNDNLGGPGSWKNLTPLSREGNHQHESQAESVVKAAVSSGAIVEYNITAQYSPRSDKAGLIKQIQASTDADKDVKIKIVEGEDMVPRGLNCEAYILKANGSKLERQQTLLSQTVMNPIERTPGSYYLSGSQPFERVRLNSMDVDEIMRLSKVEPAFTTSMAQGIADLRKKRKVDYGTYEVLARELSEANIMVSKQAFEKWNKNGWVVL